MLERPGVPSCVGRIHCTCLAEVVVQKIFKFHQNIKDQQHRVQTGQVCLYVARVCSKMVGAFCSRNPQTQLGTPQVKNESYQTYLSCGDLEEAYYYQHTKWKVALAVAEANTWLWKKWGSGRGLDCKGRSYWLLKFSKHSSLAGPWGWMIFALRSLKLWLMWVFPGWHAWAYIWSHPSDVLSEYA